jgi:hypothetical protein
VDIQRAADRRLFMEIGSDVIRTFSHSKGPSHPGFDGLAVFQFDDEGENAGVALEATPRATIVRVVFTGSANASAD